MGQRHYLSATGQRRQGLSVCLLGYDQQASSWLAGGATMPEKLVAKALQRAFWRSRSRRAYSRTPTGVASTVATLTVICCTTTKLCACRVAAVIATIIEGASFASATTLPPLWHLIKRLFGAILASPLNNSFLGPSARADSSCLPRPGYPDG